MLNLLAVAALLAAPAPRAVDNDPPVIGAPVTSVTPGGVVSVLARITDASKFFPQVFYRYGAGQDWEKPLDMKPVKDAPHMFGANIQARGAGVEFYIEAYDEVGNGPARAGSPESPIHVAVGASEPKPAPVAAAPPAATAPSAAPPPAAPTWAGRAPMGATSRAQSGAAPTRIWTWAVGGTGLGLLAGGLIAGLAAKTAGDAYDARLKDPGNNPATLQSQYDATQGLGTKATILTISGAVLLAGGVALYFFEPGLFGNASASVAAAPVENGGAVAVAGRF